MNWLGAVAAAAVSLSGASPASAATARSSARIRPVLVRDHGRITAIVGLSEGTCEAVDETCTGYASAGTILSVRSDSGGHLVGFVLRDSSGADDFQNLDPDVLPAAARGWLRTGRKVLVVGTSTGQGQVSVPAAIISLEVLPAAAHR